MAQEIPQDLSAIARALDRLQERGLAASKSQVVGGRARREFRITTKGRRALVQADD